MWPLRLLFMATMWPLRLLLMTPMWLLLIQTFFSADLKMKEWLILMAYQPILGYIMPKEVWESRSLYVHIKIFVLLF